MNEKRPRFFQTGELDHNQELKAVGSVSDLGAWKQFIHLGLHFRAEDALDGIERDEAVKKVLHQVGLLLDDEVIIPFAPAMVVHKPHALEQAEMAAHCGLRDSQNLLDVANTRFTQIIEEKENLQPTFIGKAFVKSLDILGCRIDEFHWRLQRWRI
jgi:hypothetical protein